jgi:hypothetical protein
MASNVVLSSNFNTQKLSFSQLKVLDSGGKQAYVNYDGGMFIFQTPSCNLPYGMSAFDKAGPVKYNVDLSLRGYDEDGKMKQFYESLQKLDDYMIDQGVKNSKQWFKSDLSRDVIKAFYTPVIRIPIDKDGNRKPYPPTIKLSLKQKRDSQDFDVQCYDEKKSLFKGIPLEELLVKGAQATCLIQCTGVWFAGSKFGLSWKLVQALITNLPQNARNLTFIDDGDLVPSKPAQQATQQEDDEEEDEEDEAFSAPPPKQSVIAAVLPKTTAKVAPAPVEDDDEEDADDVEPVPVPKKATTIVKKKIVAKK